jgi:FixJ family two-component response regulator
MGFDFLIKPVSSDALLRAVERAVAHHEVARRRNVQLEGLTHIAKLTPREKEVFELAFAAIPTSMPPDRWVARSARLRLIVIG